MSHLKIMNICPLNNQGETTAVAYYEYGFSKTEAGLYISLTFSMSL